MIKSKFAWQNINQTPYRNPNISLNEKKHNIIDDDVSDLENLTPTIAIGDKGFLVTTTDSSKITISILNSEELFINNMEELGLFDSYSGFSNGTYGYILQQDLIYKFLISDESYISLSNDLNINSFFYLCTSNNYVGLIYNSNGEINSFFISYYLFSNDSKKNNIYNCDLNQYETKSLTANQTHCIIFHFYDQIKYTSYFNIMTVSEVLFFADCITDFYIKNVCSNETSFLTFFATTNNYMYMGTYATNNVINFFGNITMNVMTNTIVNNEYRAVCVQNDWDNKLLSYVEFSTKSNTINFGDLSSWEICNIGFSGI